MKALQNIRVLDLSRVLAGPYCTQILGDLGAEIIKIERPGEGDDTRLWGPPYLKDRDGIDTNESAYYLSCNRNKKSVTLNIATPEGQGLLHRLLAGCDILIENFKLGSLAKYGFDYDQLKDQYPSLVYCSITGFGRAGPIASEPGYDFLAQGMAGFMAHTGAPDAPPTKAGVAISDIITGLNAAIGILSALRVREKTGKGQLIDVALTDCTLSAMTNIAQYYLTSRTPAPRVGNAHPTIVPYQLFESLDDHIIIAVGNNEQFKRFCQILGQPEWASDPRFARNQDRVKNREILVPMIATALKAHSTAHWLKLCQDENVPAGPVNTMDKVFTTKQIQVREMEIEMNHPLCPDPVHLVGSPLKFSETPVSYELPPPFCGEHTEEVLKNLLDLDDKAIAELREKKVI